MPRYIDADKIEEFANSLDSLSESRLMDTFHIIATQIPAEDVELIVHAKWLNKEIIEYYGSMLEGSRFAIRGICSNCNNEVETPVCDYLEDLKAEGLFNRCPYCGAKMDEKEMS